MNMSWKGQLEQLLEIPVNLQARSRAAWDKELQGVAESIPAGEPHSAQRITMRDGEQRFVIQADRDAIQFIAYARGVLNEKEHRIVTFILEQLLGGQPEQSAASKKAPGNGQEQQCMELGTWIVEELDAGRMQAVIPDSSGLRSRINEDMIPFYIQSESDTTSSGYEELKKLLDSFFEEEVVLIPLKEQEWLVLTPDTLLHEEAADIRGDEPEESPEDMLASISLGLHDMLASEWIGESHIAVHLPMLPTTSVVETVAILRETVMLGRKFHMADNIHLPWAVHLERLLNSIPETQRLRYMEQVINRTDLLLEPEIITTLEMFFSMNCNVSDTAKKLFIHRNTLLYRLDKLKQDTGLDVRLFRDAVLVKIILLLYKVTKRK